jgi:hypothetical protein
MRSRGEVISDRQRNRNYANAIGGNARANTKAGLDRDAQGQCAFELAR